MKRSIWLYAVPMVLLGNSVLSANAEETAPAKDAPAAKEAPPVQTPPAAPSAPATTESEPKFNQGILFPYSLLDEAFKNHVDKNGNVDYALLKSDRNLALFVKAVATADLSKFPVFTIPADPEKKDSKPREDHTAEMVFWINAYNGLMVKAIADAYPIDGVGQIADFFTAKTRTVAGQNYSFEEMQKKIIAFDPRAIFALTNGMRGGPMLSPTAVRYVEAHERLDAAVKAFMNDSRNINLDRIQNKVVVNDFLGHVDEVFKPAGGRGKWLGIRTLLAGYVDQRADRNYYTTNDYQVLFAPSDGSLNGRRVD